MALALAAVLSAAFTAVLGVGGGILLLGALSLSLPMGALIPVHGVAQLAGNISRTGLGWRHVRWPLVTCFAVGALPAAFWAAPYARGISEDTLNLTLGAFLLIAIWVPRKAVGRLPTWIFAPVGAVQSAAALFVGAIGPWLSPFLVHRDLDRDEVVVNHGAMMVVIHTAKTAAFAASGFDFAPYGGWILVLVVSASLGSWIGTRLRPKLSERRFRQAYTWLVTLLGLRCLAAPFL